MADEIEVGEYFKKQGYRKKEGQYLDVEMVIQIFAMLSCGVPAQKIGAHFAVSTQMIYHIKNGSRWGWVRNKLMEETPEKHLRHAWIPDMEHAGEFRCADCGMKYNQLVMHAICPVRKGADNKPIYLDWDGSKHAVNTIPAADLEKMREFNRKEEVKRSLEELRQRDAAQKAAQGKNSSQGRVK